MRPFLIQLGESTIKGDIEGFLKHVDVLIINVPPNLRKNPKSNYLKKMGMLQEQVKKSGISHILFISSTSVYGNVEGEITEETVPNPVTNSGNQLLKSEQLFLTTLQFQRPSFVLED